MLMSKHPEPDTDKSPQPRTGHGSASVIARLNEQISRTQPSAVEEPAYDPPSREISRETSPIETPSPTHSNAPAS